MNTPKIALVSAVSRNGVIGRNNTLPWRLPADLARFKQLTLGHPIIMGRKTWDSLGRPLPGRRNIVISRQAGLQLGGAECFISLQAAIAACAGVEQVFVIGGGELYQQALPMAAALYITEVQADIEGDTYFPSIDGEHFEEAQRQSHSADERNEWAFDFVDYVRKQPLK